MHKVSDIFLANTIEFAKQKYECLIVQRQKIDERFNGECMILPSFARLNIVAFRG